MIAIIYNLQCRAFPSIKVRHYLNYFLILRMLSCINRASLLDTALAICCWIELLNFLHTFTFESCNISAISTVYSQWHLDNMISNRYPLLAHQAECPSGVSSAFTNTVSLWVWPQLVVHNYTFNSCRCTISCFNKSNAYPSPILCHFSVTRILVWQQHSAFPWPDSFRTIAYPNIWA